MLEFEHIVQINDPEDSRVKPLSREQLWQGLLSRARNPGKFNSGLSCRIDTEQEQGFMRYIQAGDTEFCEEVLMVPQEEIRTRTSGNQPQIRAESITTIEEPVTGYLFVRFVYRRDLDNGPDGILVGEHLKSAYQQVDIDSIALIRMLAEADVLDRAPN